MNGETVLITMKDNEITESIIVRALRDRRSLLVVSFDRANMLILTDRTRR